jgi:SH3 domain protein
VKKISAFILLITAASACWAEPARYVTDRFEVTLRTGQSTQHSISRMLTSGTRVELLEVNEQSGYARVRTPDGTEGWVLKRYLMEIPSARERLATAEQKLATLELDNQRLQERNTGLEAQRQTMEKQEQQLETENRQIKQDLTEIRRAAADPLAIDKQNKELQTRVLLLEQELDTLRHENATLREQNARDWFLAGAGVVFVGILLGLFLPKLRWRRRSGWDSL